MGQSLGKNKFSAGGFSLTEKDLLCILNPDNCKYTEEARSFYAYI